jgi:hypothetical protein
MRINFKGVDKEIRSGGRSFRFPEGDFLFKVIKHEARKNESSGARGISWQMQCVSPKYKGKTLYHYTSLKPEALWNLRNLVFACTGRNVAGKVLDFDPTSIYGKIFAGTTEDDSYIRDEGGANEKEVIKSVLADIRPKSQLEGASDDEDEDEDDDEVEDEDDEEDVEDEEEDDEPPAKPKKKKGTKKKSKRTEELEDVDVDEI